MFNVQNVVRNVEGLCVEIEKKVEKNVEIIFCLNSLFNLILWKYYFLFHKTAENRLQKFNTTFNTLLKTLLKTVFIKKSGVTAVLDIFYHILDKFF